MENTIDKKKLIFAIAGIVVGLIIFFLPAPEGLTQPAMHVLGVLVWAIIYWVGAVLPEAITGMLMGALFIVVSAGNVTIAESFNAFSGGTIWLVIAAIGLGVSVKACGLLERVSLLLLKLFPKNFFGRSVGLMLSTFIVGPFVPSTMAKTGILTPIARGIAESSGYEMGSKQSNGIFMAYWTGLKSCSTFFITASVVSAALVGMLPADTAAQYGSIGTWFLYTIPCLIVFLVLSALWINLRYGEGKGRSKEEKAAAAKATAEFINGRLAELGKWSKHEKLMGVLVILCVILWLTKKYHGIAEWIITLFVVVLAFAFKVIDMKTFISGVPWGVIIFVGTAISIGNVLPAVGVIDWLTTTVGPMTNGFFANPFLLVIGTAIFTFLMRFVIVSESGFLAIATAILFPLALAAGVNPWIVAVVLNAFTNTFQLPYQSSLLIGTAGVGGEDFVVYNECSKFNVPFCLIFLIGFLVSVPIWMGLGIVYI